MKIISVAAVTAGGKTTVVNKLKERFGIVSEICKNCVCTDAYVKRRWTNMSI